MPRHRQSDRSLSKRQQKEVDDLSRFIDAHGGRLGAFRGYGAGARVSRPPADVSDPPATTGVRDEPTAQ